MSGRAARIPVVALAVLCVGLALHNLAMAELWDAGVRGGALDLVAAWKEALLAVAIAVAAGIAVLRAPRKDIVALSHKSSCRTGSRSPTQSSSSSTRCCRRTGSVARRRLTRGCSRSGTTCCPSAATRSGGC